MAARRYLCFLILAALCGCAHEPVRSSTRLEGAREDLTGLQDQTGRALLQNYIREGKVFLYATRDSDSPVLADKKDAAFARQFKTAPVSGGYKEAAEFNRRMIAYMRGQLRRGICPEHKGVPLKGAMLRKGRNPPVRILICPVDNRVFSP